MSKITPLQNKKEANSVVAFNAESSTASIRAAMSGKKELDCMENVQTKTITNLNTDCMEIIFKYLELNDLLNIADSSKAFYSAACLVYKIQYANAYMIFDRDYFR